MNIYGYESAESELIGLQEITLQVSIDELNELIEFMKNTLLLMREHENFGSEHFKDFAVNKSLGMPDIIISK
ncbi:hypothetical protein DD235_12700 [Corticimicrobacter populi]|uniref:Uncharacterized protein n=2 Tax=Corticimicrobacter populi TaxID=2175229 RepID=A0A2V1K0R6_9BURK|nr:hypothetical protein DD235_12700 [Corticimicrobacter populi]